MTSTADSVLVSAKGETKLVISRTLRTTPELAWEVHNAPAYVSQWLGLEGHLNHITDMDLRPGGAWRFGQRGPDGREMIFGGVYRALDRPQMFRFSIDRLGADLSSEKLEESLITIWFDEHVRGTTVTLVCEFSSTALRDRVAAGGLEWLRRAYDRMDKLLVTADASQHLIWTKPGKPAFLSPPVNASQPS